MLHDTNILLLIYISSNIELCPFDVSWADKAQEFNIAHTPSECSRNGLCNRNTGDCQCFPGYEGEACQRIVCGNALDLKGPVCSGHGTCQTIGIFIFMYLI